MNELVYLKTPTLAEALTFVKRNEQQNNQIKNIKKRIDFKNCC